VTDVADFCKLQKNTSLALGHKRIANTEIYTRKVVFREEEYYSATARLLKKSVDSLKTGEFFAKMQRIKVFRKPK